VTENLIDLSYGVNIDGKYNGQCAESNFERARAKRGSARLLARLRKHHPERDPRRWETVEGEL
jgi:hypothetical protein